MRPAALVVAAGALAALPWLRAPSPGGATLGAAPAPSRQTAGPPLPPGLPGEAPDGAAERGEALTIYLVTMGPGDAVWERFGHNAIWIHDEAEGTDLAYNWGLFSFSQTGFIPRLIQGTMLYWMAPFDVRDMVREYVATNRSVWAQELELAPEQRAWVQDFVRWNALPENRFYRYDYYRDNCSTRVRDVLDRATGGAIRSVTAGVPTGTTWRWHTRRLTQVAPLVYAGIQFVLGNPGDAPIDAWERTFLPMELREEVARARVEDGEGGTVPLVRRELVLFDAVREAAPEASASRLLPALGLGVALAAALLLLSVPAGRGGAAARVALVGVAGLWSLVVGVLGTILLGAWAFTDHVFWYGNENLLQANPLSLLTAVLLVGLLLKRRPSPWLVGTAAAVAWLAALGFALQPLPGLDQVNGEVIAVTLLPHLALAGALVRLRGAPDPGGGGAPGVDAPPAPGPGGRA